jgi:hypothetical protein
MRGVQAQRLSCSSRPYQTSPCVRNRALCVCKDLHKRHVRSAACGEPRARVQRSVNRYADVNRNAAGTNRSAPCRPPRPRRRNRGNSNTPTLNAYAYSGVHGINKGDRHTNQTRALLCFKLLSGIQPQKNCACSRWCSAEPVSRFARCACAIE